MTAPAQRTSARGASRLKLSTRFAWLLAALLCVLGLPQTAVAATFNVAVRDRTFGPRELHIEPGDTVVWRASGFRTHTVTSDDRGLFNSGDIRAGDTFSRRFNREGRFPYFCRYHGARGGVGMSGLIVVGNPDPPNGGSNHKRPKVHVPKDFRTIRRAVALAAPGSTIIVAPGIYTESINVSTPNLVIRGVDRFRTRVGGGNARADGFRVTADHVSIKNLTVRRFTNSGISFSDVTGYTVSRVDSIKNRTYGIRATNSYDGVIANSFAWGSGDSAYRIEDCLACSTLIDDVRGSYSYLGYAGVNSTGVVVRDSVLRHNGVGLAALSDAGTSGSPNRGTVLLNNVVADNNYTSVPAAGLSAVSGIPFGTGIWFAGARNGLIRRNNVLDNSRYGVLVTQSMDGIFAPVNDMTVANQVDDAGTYSLAWDGAGDDNCFSDNVLGGPTGPPDLQDVYGCDDRPFSGVPFAPVAEDVADSLIFDPSRQQSEPPDPTRPRCQRGVRGCNP
jgi:plastocyanin